MSNYVEINSKQPLGGKLQANVNDFIAASQELSLLLGYANQQIVNNDYSIFQQLFGIPDNGQTGTNSAGYNVWYQMSAVNTLLQNAAFTTFISQMGD